MKKITKFAIIGTHLVIIPATLFAIYQSYNFNKAVRPGIADTYPTTSRQVIFESNVSRDYSAKTTDTVTYTPSGNYIRLHGVNMRWDEVAYPIAFNPGNTSYAVLFKQSDSELFSFTKSRVRRVSLYKADDSTASFRIEYRIGDEESFTPTSSVSCYTGNKEYTIFLNEEHPDVAISNITELRIVNAGSESRGCFSRVTIGYFGD